ncbi:MAG: hypothetical protein KJ645_14570, partial [Planctomycetes bacterium]|nr:hypothetical protein [Planctomycetota bacterium]
MKYDIFIILLIAAVIGTGSIFLNDPDPGSPNPCEDPPPTSLEPACPPVAVLQRVHDCDLQTGKINQVLGKPIQVIAPPDTEVVFFSPDLGRFKENGKAGIVVQTDPAGLASARLQLGENPGAYTVIAYCSDLPAQKVIYHFRATRDGGARPGIIDAERTPVSPSPSLPALMDKHALNNQPTMPDKKDGNKIKCFNGDNDPKT